MSLDQSTVLQWAGNGSTWVPVGTEASALFAGDAGVFATNPATGDIYRYDGTPGRWTPAGSAGAQFATGGRDLYALTPRRDAVMRYDSPGHWTLIGGPALDIYAGGAGLFATRPGDGHLMRYLGREQQWERIGNPGLQFAVGPRDIYGLNSDGVFHWTGQGDGWHRIGPTAVSIHAGGAGLFAVDAVDAADRIRRFNGTGTWTDIGQRGTALIADNTHLYRLAADRQSLSLWNGNGDSWTQIGGPSSAIASTG
ncbi:hypothetical protein [Kitasatospora sp. NPDC057223]|uniref:hypothetical protein n=1 Tax=Kitasatospora sp. NPDC057223 TaxID=3346055 RepID=UPI00362E6286